MLLSCPFPACDPPGIPSQPRPEGQSCTTRFTKYLHRICDGHCAVLDAACLALMILTLSTDFPRSHPSPGSGENCPHQRGEVEVQPPEEGQSGTDRTAGAMVVRRQGEEAESQPTYRLCPSHRVISGCNFIHQAPSSTKVFIRICILVVKRALFTQATDTHTYHMYVPIFFAVDYCAFRFFGLYRPKTSKFHTRTPGGPFVFFSCTRHHLILPCVPPRPNAFLRRRTLYCLQL